MLEEKLRDGYTLYYSFNDGNLRGGYLKKTDRGLCPLTLGDDEKMLIGEFPNILESLANGNTLQICRSDIGYMFNVMLGKVTREGPYGENDCLYDVVTTYGVSPFSALNDVDNLLEKSNKKEIQYQKAYRLYGQDRYSIR